MCWGGSVGSRVESWLFEKTAIEIELIKLSENELLNKIRGKTF